MPAILVGVVTLLANGAWAARRMELEKEIIKAQNAEVANSSRDQGEGDWLWQPSCSEIIPGAKDAGWIAWLSSSGCMCPNGWVVAGPGANCRDHVGKTHFPKTVEAGACSCEYPGHPRNYIEIDNLKPNFACPREYGFAGVPEHDGLPDFLDSAHEWCNSEHVPAEKRVPEQLRGLYWMKDLPLPDVAFCSSLGEWDEETKTMRLVVWTHFVVRKQEYEKTPWLLEKTAKFPLFGKPLVYSLQFTNDTLKYANIWTNFATLNTLIKFPLIDIAETPDGLVRSARAGDIFDRPSTIAGVDGGRYYPIRIMDDDGTKHLDRYKLMKELEGNVSGTLTRLRPLC